jgi:hypothetical protein
MDDRDQVVSVSGYGGQSDGGVYAARGEAIRSKSISILYNSDVREPALFGYFALTKLNE